MHQMSVRILYETGETEQRLDLVSFGADSAVFIL